MPDTLRRLAGPTLLTAAAATVYTTPASTSASILGIHVANTSASPATFTMSIGADAAGTRLYSGVLIPGNGTLDWSGLYVVTAAEILQAYSSVTGVLTLTISGVEVT